MRALSVNDNVETLRPNGITVCTPINFSLDIIPRGLEHRGSSSTSDPYAELTEACGRGDSSTIGLMLRLRQERNVTSVPNGRYCDRVRFCPIHATLYNDNVEVMESLLQHTDSEHEVDQVLQDTMYCKKGNGWPALHVAATWGNLSMVQLLLKNGASINAETENAVQAIHLAAMRGGFNENWASLILRSKTSMVEATTPLK